MFELKSRREIKAQAKAAFLGDYWKSIGVLIVSCIIMGAAGGTYIGAIFITPLTLGVLSHFVRLYRGETPLFETMFNDGFKVNYLRKVGGLFWMGLWTFLWSLLFLIPGIIKSFSYAMTPYILTNCPNVSATDALKLSMRIMKGHKFELFVFGLSFIGWYLLSIITFGLLALFYVSPYYTTALYGYFDELFQNARVNGIISRTDLGEYEVFDQTIPAV